MESLSTTFTKNNYRQPKDKVAFIEKRKVAKKATNQLIYKYSDGGRTEAGFPVGRAGDCVTRAIAIATKIPYMEVYQHMADQNKEEGRRNTADSGVADSVWKAYLTDKGWRRAVIEDVVESLPSWLEFLQAEGYTEDQFKSLSSSKRDKLSNQYFYFTGGFLNEGSLKKYPNAIFRISKHVVAAVDGIVNDSYDCIGSGKKSIYEVWVKS
jgi:hypothetical protein